MKYILGLLFLFTLPGCSNGQKINKLKTGEVKLITLDPGHFHAALVQKTMYADVNPVVHVYAPPGADVQQYLEKIRKFDKR